MCHHAAAGVRGVGDGDRQWALRRRSYAGRGTGGLERLEDGALDILSGLKMHRSEIGCAEPPVKDVDRGAGLNPPLNLNLPLVGHRDWRGSNPAHRLLDGERRGKQLPIGAMIGKAVTALCSADDAPTVSNHSGCSRHALHGLIQILVQGPTGIRRHNDIEGGSRSDHCGSRLTPRTRPGAPAVATRRRPRRCDARGRAGHRS